ncbi:MAG: hypothetical protein Q4G50_11675 [Corynebacterium sp.]|uniref:hypothetical protein n=1 Tax=Corynebacterium sp. TaxID=1720 RepID=UPI0026E08F72|nr:hypothetical protein [Corynebacterium sp.]MDO5670643.1 hypothetical protein [Corynebacterium sp.]
MAAALVVVAAALPWFTVVTAVDASLDHIFGTTSAATGYSVSFNGWGIGFSSFTAPGVEETEWGFDISLFALTLLGVGGLIAAAVLAFFRQRAAHIVAIVVGVLYPLLTSVVFGFGNIWDGENAGFESASGDISIFGVTVGGGTTMSDSAAFYLTMLIFLAVAGVGVWRLVAGRR